MGKVNIDYREEGNNDDAQRAPAMSHRYPQQTPGVNIRITRRTVVVVASLILLAGIFVQLSRIEQGKSSINNGVLSSQVENEESEDEAILAKLSEFIQLPEEEPTVATLVDVNSLKTENQFFRNAENGDKFIVYPRSKKAILYRPSIQKVVEMTVAGFNETAPAQQQSE